MVFLFPRGRPIPYTAVAVLLLGALAGCGGASQQTLDDAARSGLRAEVANIRGAVDDPAAATAAVARFRSDVRRLMDDGGLDAADGLVLLAQVDQLAAKIRAEAPTPTPAPAPAPPRTRTPDRGNEDDEEDKKEEDKKEDDEKDEDRGKESKGKKKGGRDD